MFDGFAADKVYENQAVLEHWVEECGVQKIELPASERAKLESYVKSLLNEMAAKDSEYTAPAVDALKELMEFLGYW